MERGSRHALGIALTQMGVALDVAVVAISIFFSLSLEDDDAADR